MNNIFGVLVGISMLVATMSTGIYFYEKQSIEYAKAGLEQCKYGNYKAIWVKDCNSYIKSKIEENNLKGIR